MPEIQTSPRGLGYRVFDLREPWAHASGDAKAPIVFQHGLGLNGLAWLPWIRRLTPNRRMIAIDMRGHGASKAMWSPPSLDVSDYADDVLDVLNTLEIERCHFVGESFGGTAGLYLGIHAPKRITSITFASTGWRGDLVNNIGNWPEVLAAPGGIEAWGKKLADGSFDPSRDDAALIKWACALHIEALPEAVAAVVLSLQAADLGPDLHRLTMPLLNIVAGRSPFVDGAQHPILAERAADCTQLDFPMAKHRVFLTEAAACADALQARLSD
jgi:pimeloyl-ACP methyl ester carboxylesterase